MSAIWDTYKYGKENPFYNDPMQKAYYHPSPPRKMDGIARQTSVNSSHKDIEHLTEDEERSRRYFLDRSNSFLISRVGELDLGPDGDSVSLDESWPQSERPSTISIISEVESLTPPSAVPQKSNSSAAVVVGSRPLDVGEEEKRKKQQQRSKSEVSGKKKGSTLSKYIERFRNSEPMSREQRRRRLEMATEDAEEEEDFWWLQSPSSSSSATTDHHHHHHPLNSHHLHNVVVGSVVQGKDGEDSLLDIDEQLKKKRKLLQENKTNNYLIEQMSSVGSSHPAVSTVGLGSDDTTGGSFEEEPYRPRFVRARDPIVPQTTTHRHRRHDNDDDILYRWRIQRKRELAKDQVTKFRIEPTYSNVFSSQLRQWDADAVKTTSEMTLRQQHHQQQQTTADAHISQPTHRKTERDAFIAMTSAAEGEGGVGGERGVGGVVVGGASDEQQSSFISCVPTTTTIDCCCHRVAPSSTVSIVCPHCHFSCCDVLTNQSAIQSLNARDASKHNDATTTIRRRRRAELGDGDGPKQVVTLKEAAVSISSESRMDDGKRIVSHAAVDDLDRDLSDENNIPEKDVQRHSTAQDDICENERTVNCKKLTLQKQRVKNERSLEAAQKVVSRESTTAVDDCNDTEVWQTTDNEGERERWSASEAAADEELRRDQRKRLMGGGVRGGGAAGDRAEDMKNSRRTIDVVALEDKERGIQQKTKSDKDRRQRLCNAKNEISSNAKNAISSNAKNEISSNAKNAISSNAKNAISSNAKNAISSSPIPIRSTIKEVVNDRLLLLATSASLVTSSIDNFELSSLDDLTLTELDEEEEELAVVVDDGSACAAANLSGRRSPVDLKSVICSDGEEFADDDILCNLRQRRLFCLQRLQELDDRINLESRKST